MPIMAETSSPDRLRVAWVRYLLATTGRTMTDAAELSGVGRANVARIVSGIRGAGDVEAPTAQAVWSALAELTGQPIDVLQAPPRRLNPHLARELSMLARDG